MKPTYMIAIRASALLLCLSAVVPVKAQDMNRNYVMKTVHASADSTDTLARRQAVAYYDGLGRPVQTVRRRGAPDRHDLADRIEYDSLGREYRTWQTVRSLNSNGFPVDSVVFIPVAVDIYSDTAPFTQTLYDGTALDRIRKVTGPGTAWHTNEKGVTSRYLTNAGSTGSASLQCVKYAFSLSGNTGVSFSRDGLWPAGALTVRETEDEDGRTVWLFKDMRDLTILERRLAETGSGNTPAVYADTYYLYDDAGRLTAVLPPELSKYFAQGSWSGSSGSDPKVAGFAYQYRYDSRGRMIAKKLPGADWTYYIYDEGDRLVLTQDGNQRSRNEWTFRLQDALGRECLTGMMIRTYNAFSSPLALEQVIAVRDRTSGTYDYLHGYTVEGLSIPSNAVVLTVNWWDDYSFLGREPGMSGTEYGYSDPPSGSGYGVCYGTDAHGLLTGHWSRAIGEAPSAWTQTAVRETWYYDDRGRTVMHVKGYPSGSRITEQSGYAFSGELTALGRMTFLSNGTSRTEEYAYTYDNWGRPLATTHKLDGGTPLLLTSNAYDSVGRLSRTLRGGTSVQNSPSALASSYAYNVRDWLTGIGGSLFSETLTYETPRTGSTLLGQWGGNISSSKWRIDPLSSDATWYDYAYDPLGRLTEAAYGSDVVSQNDYSRTYSYDLNGNPNGRETASYSEQWTAASGNAPAAWVRTRTSPFSILQQEGYADDANGNRTAVMNALGDTLSVMRYNLLNLPEEYVATAGDTVKYVYSSDGEKLYVADNPSGSTARGTEYAANYRIENGAVTMIHTDAGYYTPVTTQGGLGVSYSHIWYLKDHLGNNRVLADASGNAVALHDYDPYGEEIAVASSSQPYPLPPGATDSPYLYGGKEWNETTSTYDFEARYLSPSFHRFTTMDPLAEKYYSISPYAYCAGNPVNLVDPSGLFIDDYYSSINGKFLGSDAYGYAARLIDPNQYSKITKGQKENGTLSVTETLRNNSQIITFDSQKIETDAQSIADDSRADRLEHQSYIVLDRESAIVTSIVGETGINNESVVSYYPGPITGASFYGKPGGPIIIGQIHGHPQSINAIESTEMTMSELDINVATKLQIPIYGVDAMYGKTGDSMEVHVALPSGTINHNVRSTIGTSGGTTRISWGLEALRTWGRSGNPNYQ